MKLFFHPTSFVTCRVGPHARVRLPLVPGILKHPDIVELRRLLRQYPRLAEKYTRQALHLAAWPILKTFPRPWLLHLLNTTPMRPARKKALRFLLS